MPIIGTVQATGEFAPSSSGDTYAILDAKYMRDGFRNVDTITDLDSITPDRRIAGMVAGVSGGTAYYKLNPSPWLYDFTDWSVFSTGSSGSTLNAANGLTLTGDTIILGGNLTGNTIISSTSTEKLIITDSDGIVLQSRDSNGIFKLAEYTPSVYTGSTLVIDCFSSGNYYENSNVILNFAGSFQTYINTNSVYNFGTSNVYNSSSDVNNWGGSNSFLTASTIFNLGVGNTFTNNNAVSIFGNGNIVDDFNNTTILGNNNTYSGTTYSDKFIIGNANNNLFLDGLTGILTSKPTYTYTGNGDTNVGLLAINSSGEVYNTSVSLLSLNNGIKYHILSGETVDIAADYEYFVYGNLTLEGTINNAGKIIIMNGAFINSGGTYNQLSGGSMTLVSSQTINKYSITTGLTANTPLVITHNLGTPDVIITVKDLNTGYKIGVDEYNYNLNDVTVESTNTLTNIKITIIG